MTDEKKKVLSYIDEKADVIIDTSDKIWDFAELSLREFKSGELYAQVLREEGFQVEHPFCGIETASGRKGRGERKGDPLWLPGRRGSRHQGIYGQRRRI